VVGWGGGGGGVQTKCFHQILEEMKLLKQF